MPTVSACSSTSEAPSGARSRRAGSARSPSCGRAWSASTGFMACSGLCERNASASGGSARFSARVSSSTTTKCTRRRASPWPRASSFSRASPSSAAAIPMRPQCRLRRACAASVSGPRRSTCGTALPPTGSTTAASLPVPNRAGRSRRWFPDERARTHPELLCPLHLQMRRHRGRPGWPLRRPRARSIASDGAGPLRQGPRRPGARLPRRSPPPPPQAHAPEGRSGSGLAADRLGRGPRPRGDPPASDRRSPRTRERGVQSGLRVHLGHLGFGNLDLALDACIRQPQFLRVDGAVRLGPDLCHAVHLRHRDGRVQLAHARSGARRLHPVLGLQPEPGPSLPRHRDGALALGIAGVMLERGWYDRAFIRDWTNGPFLVRADTGRLLRARDLSPEGSPEHNVAWDVGGQRPLLYDPEARRYLGGKTAPAPAGQYTIEPVSAPVFCRPAFELCVELCRRYPPHVVEEICGVERAQIEAAARLLWEARPVSCYPWSGVEQQSNATQIFRAIAML